MSDDIQSEIYRPSDDPDFPGHMVEQDIEFYEDEVVEIDN